MQQRAQADGVRIGELGRRIGVAPATLRAWEQRYGIPRPARSRAGQRLYGPEQERRLRRMLALMAEGFSPQVAARMALQEHSGPQPAPTVAAVDGPAGELRAALESLDERAAHAALDRLLAAYALDTVIGRVVLPLLAEVGDRWATGELSVGQEHFASALLAGRLRGLGHALDLGGGPRALLACPPGERHELGLLCFAVALRARGWRVTYLGADTPLGAVGDAARLAEPDLLVLTATMPTVLPACADGLAALAAELPLALGGRGATPGVASRAGARLLADDVLRAADDLAAAPATGAG
jgi:DNA-binding transcriptional MerR regulator